MIDAARVTEIFTDCLFKEGEDTSVHIKVEGIMSTFGFHPERLKTHKEEIIEMLRQLPDDFHQKIGGGMSFLNACNDKEGVQWGEHMNMDQLFCLGMGIGKVRSPLPKSLWNQLPGGMPYFTVLDLDDEKETESCGTQNGKTSKTS